MTTSRTLHDFLSNPEAQEQEMSGVVKELLKDYSNVIEVDYKSMLIMTHDKSSPA